MLRTTVDFGIDLGTTNSSISALEGADTSVFENNEGQKCTPSAVWVDKRGRLYVGRQAKERLFDDPDNAFCEFKLKMGYPEEYRFAAAKQKMRPEELSSEVLKALRGDVQRRSGEEVQAAVITVPAAFEQPQCDATTRAAELAGLAYSPLLQEPIAAALAYGFQSDSDRVFWLVFDLGGGTFDAALINVRDGTINVVNHGGDNNLGGKLLDWAIVEQLLVPALTKEYRLSNFTQANPKWRAAFGKLKLRAEEAKIRVSQVRESPILIDPLCQDDRGEWVSFSYDLQQAEVERLIEPLVKRAVHTCQQVLAEKRLTRDDIQKVILVGGPTMTPILRQILTEDLGIPLEFSIDPMTVVARGAAIFARTKPVEGKIKVVVPSGTYVLTPEYKTIDEDPQPLVGGKITPPEGASIAGCTIEFVEQKSQWRSGQVKLSATGGFQTELRAEPGRENTYLIELRDAAGHTLSLQPDRLSIIVKKVGGAAQTAIHSIGVLLANNEMVPFIEKGSPLPARHLETTFVTTRDLRRGERGAMLRIPLVEGENRKRGDRNREIGVLDIPSDAIKRDVPAESAIQITVKMDESRRITAEAYLPILDDTIERVIETGKETVDLDKLSKAVDQEKARYTTLRAEVKKQSATEAEAVFTRIDEEQMLEEIEAAFASARGGGEADAPDRCWNRLLDLQMALDEVDDALEWPKLVAEANSLLPEAKNVLAQFGKEEHRQAFATLEKELNAAMAARDEELLRTKIAEVRTLAVLLLREDPAIWRAWLDNIENNHKPYLTNPGLGQSLIAQGRKAIREGDFGGLRQAVEGLFELLPTEVQKKISDVERR